MAIDRLKKALSEHPHGLSLQTALKAAVEEVTVSSHICITCIVHNMEVKDVQASQY